MPKPAQYLYCLAALLGGAACAKSPPAAGQVPATWSIAPVTSPIGTAPATITVRGRLQPGWHIYSVTQAAGGPTATRVTLPAGQPFEQAGEITVTPQPHVAFDEAFRMKVELHEKSVDIMVPVRATQPLRNGDSLRMNVRYQVCNASLCYPPKTEKLVAAVPATGK